MDELVSALKRTVMTASSTGSMVVIFEVSCDWVRVPPKPVAYNRPIQLGKGRPKMTQVYLAELLVERDCSI
eukprot:m.142183 g.142183  ORF g.142183 m.142183 type:complete len:71 (+) comp52613_c0_seq3:572-784(+)